nr:PREDICTED: aldehyde dehydrogenase family 3 member B1-like [Equus przewalskii]
MHFCGFCRGCYERAKKPGWGGGRCEHGSPWHPRAEACRMDSVGDTLQRLRETFSAGRTRPAEFRATQLEGLGRFLRDNKQLLQEALARDLRKPDFESEVSEFSMAQHEIHLALRNLRAWMKDEKVPRSLGTQLDRAFIRKEPFGLVLIIVPWNYPLNLTLVPLVGALAAGNCVVLKPSEISKNMEQVLAEVLPRYLDQGGAGPGVIPPRGVPAPGLKPAAGSKRLRATWVCPCLGSPRVGRIVMTAAAKHLTPVTLELGGKNPCYVDDNCDPETVANRVAFFRYFNTVGSSPGLLQGPVSSRSATASLLILVISAWLAGLPLPGLEASRLFLSQVVKQVLARTSSGGFCGNDGFMHVSLASLPFGGVGASGMGRYHGKFSFDTFSHHRGCLLRSQGMEKIYSIRYPPYTPRNLRMLLVAMETRSCSCTLL